MISNKAGLVVLSLVWVLVDLSSARKGKLFSLFNVIQFENGPCVGSNGRDGTCYTSGECDQRGGTNDGTCAAGYGVCCTFVQMGSGTSSQATSYLVPSNPMPESGDSSYKICKLSNDICRIRLDFQIFVLANPQLAPQKNARESDEPMNEGGIGDCVTDSFSVIVPGGIGSPEICGFNTGQHMILDASDMCITASFTIGISALANRDWDIKVSQMECSNKDSGPPGCLQYFTDSIGVISSFGFAGSSANEVRVPHLSNQHYSICFRNAPEICGICFTPAAFGLSGDEIETHLVGPRCTTDYLMIPNLDIVDTEAGTNTRASRLCGRIFALESDQTMLSSVCSLTKPFKMVFKTDGVETEKELAKDPLGTVGFSLNYAHKICD